MCSNGLILKAFYLILLLGINNLTSAYAGWIAMPGQLDSEFSEEIKATSDEDPFIQVKTDEFAGDQFKIKNENSVFFPGKNKEFKGKLGKGRDTGLRTFGTTDTKSYAEFSNEAILENIRGNWSSTMSLAYILDNYDYTDKNNIFENVYRQGSNSLNLGTIWLKFKNKIGAGFFYGIDLAVGYNRGNGLFIDSNGQVTGDESNTEFKLYTIPAEINLGFRTSIGKYFGASLNAGGGLMGLWQNRDDRNDNDPTKDKTQVGYGFSGEGVLHVAISEIFGQLGVDLYSDYLVTRFTLDIYTRYQNYTSFQNEDITISGQTFGLGLTFEYL